MEFSSIQEAYDYLQHQLIFCKEDEYEEIIDNLFTSNIDSYKVIKHYINGVKLNKNARKKLLDIGCKEPTTALFIINDCDITEDERNSILNIIFQHPEYSLLFRRYATIKNEEEKYKAMECIIKNEEYFNTLVSHSSIRHFIQIDNKDREIMINKIINEQNIKIAKAAYYSKYFNVNGDIKDRLCALATMQKLIGD